MIRSLAAIGSLALALAQAPGDAQAKAVSNGKSIAEPAPDQASPPKQLNQIGARPPAQSKARARPLPDATARRIVDANRMAARPPTRPGFVNAVQVHAFEAGAVYDLLTAPGQVADVALEQGESLNAVASGDTLRWVIGDTASGTAAARRVHVLVKPVEAGLSTNVVITTDRRSYHLRLRSTSGAAMTGISWTYPRDALLLLQRATASAQAAAPVAGGIDLSTLRFDYTIDGDRPGWRPLRAFDDGRQTFIEFAETIAVGEAPPLFVIGSAGAELVNYRMQGRYYVVDRLFDRAELRLGLADAKTVRITRDDAQRRRTRKR